MPIFRLNKLVRDKFIEIYTSLGQKPAFRYLTPDEHRAELIEKIVEEVRELSAASPKKVADEIADVQQALDDLRRTYGITKKEIIAAMSAKRAEKGGFGKGVHVDTLELAEEDPWTKYYRSEPRRFLEQN